MENRNHPMSERSRSACFQILGSVPEVIREIEAPRVQKREYPKKKSSGLNPFLRIS
jgi:hypothetical protein